MDKNFNFENENKIYNKWNKSGFFNPDNLDLENKTPSYSIVMPPPNVTGTLHLGHASMLALEDILVRYYRMKGFRALWVPGTDHAAIATQTKVEKIIKEKGESRHSLGREEFLKRVNQFAKDSHDTIVNQVKKMGSSCDWSREAYTLDDVRSKAVRSVFKLMYDDGLIYRGDRVVNWCPRCHSTLADDEVEYKSQIAKLYTFKYSKDFPFAIATTRPETKLGDTAVAVNPKDKRYKKYIGKTYKTNFLGIELHLKVIADRSIEIDYGTGALGVTPAHSMADWQMAEENNLEVVKVISEDGKIKEGFGEFSGMDVFQARKEVVAKLKKEDLMIKEEDVDNNLSLCYRCDTPIEPLPSLQWFINVNKKLNKFDGKTIKEVCVDVVKKGFLDDVNKKISIYPKRFEKTYFNWMENLNDWCISRQIWFGHRIPVWYKENSGSKDDIFVGTNEPEGDGWIQDSDTLDTWFSSGLWTFTTMVKSPDDIKIEDGELKICSQDYNNFHPTNVLETGYDILFFWVARMILMTTYAVQDIPFKDVYLHGLVQDEKGKKMSKSKGNVIDPLEMIEKYGTDAVRLALVVGSAPGQDMKLAEEKIAGFRNMVNKLWNVSRFVLQKVDIKKLPERINLEDLTLADRWILQKFNVLASEVSSDIEKYNFSQAGEKLREFMWNDLADWYLEISKFENNLSKDKILISLLQNLLKLFHPFAPFVTEDIWGQFSSGHLMVARWPEGFELEQNKKNIDPENDVKKFGIVMDIISSIRNGRAENKVEPSRKIKALIAAGDSADFIKSQEILIINLKTGIEELEICEKCQEPDNSISLSVGGIKIYLLGAIDKEKEKQRLEKECSKIKNLILNIEKKLSNKEFAQKAPQNIINNEKDRLKKSKNELRDLETQLKKI